MPDVSLRGRVGRHTQSGRQCQNWPDDQKTVIMLLNAIPNFRGGPERLLGGRIVAGIASEALCKAISHFEDKYFPGQRSGFVEPLGAMMYMLYGEATKYNFGDVTDNDRLRWIEIY
jgi:hypothetical protein